MYSSVTATGLCHSEVSYRMIIEEAGKEEESGKRLADDVMWMHFQSCPPGRERLAELASFVRQFPLPQESHTYSIHEISSMFGFDRKIKTATTTTKKRVIPPKTKKFKTMMSVGHCTQRKPQLCGDPCLVVSVCSKASQPQDLSLVPNGGCQRQKAP